MKEILCYFIDRVDKAGKALFWAVLTWISCCIDLSPVVAGSSDDPFAAPTLTGKRGRLRKVSHARKFKIARIAAKGSVFKSPAGVVRGMSELGYVNQVGGSSSGANKWIFPLAYQYLHKLKKVFLFETLEVPVISLAWDATRLSKLDTLATTIYSSGLRLAAWCPPQVLAVHSRCSYRVL